MKYWIFAEKKVQGPFEETEILSMIKSGKIDRETSITNSIELTKWIPLSDIAGLNNHLASAPNTSFQTQVAEYRRICNSCGKVWHSLVSRERQIEKQQKSSEWDVVTNCCNLSGAQQQAKRNVEANQSELARLKRCPSCLSANYKEVLVGHAEPPKIPH